MNNPAAVYLEAGFQIAMKHSVPVRVLECIGDRSTDLKYGVERQRTRPEARFQRAAGNLFRDEKTVSVAIVEVEDRRDARVRETGKDDRVTAKAFTNGRVPHRRLKSLAQSLSPVLRGRHLRQMSVRRQQVVKRQPRREP